MNLNVELQENEKDDQQRGTYLAESFRALGISLSPQQIQQFLIYYDFLIEKNSVMNLTAIKEFEEVVTKHFIDSVSLVKGLSACSLTGFGSREDAPRVIDVGTGAGFPGIPLKIVFPDIRLTLADSLGKRINFLNELIEKCRFENIDTVHARAEDLAGNRAYREQYDFCVSRAVANLSVLCEYCIPFVKEDGFFISYKSGKAEEEIRNAGKAIEILGGSMLPESPVSFTLPGTDIERLLVMIRKTKKTPGKYPRKAGIPSRQPL